MFTPRESYNIHQAQGMFALINQMKHYSRHPLLAEDSSSKPFPGKKGFVHKALYEIYILKLTSQDHFTTMLILDRKRNYSPWRWVWHGMAMTNI